MALRSLLRPSNRRVRVLVGVLLVGLFCLQYTTSGPEPLVEGSANATLSAEPEGVEKAKELARTDHEALLQYCIDTYDAKHQDYSCRLVKHEVIRGKDHGRQEMAVRFKQNPYSVYMEWKKGAGLAGKVIYVQGKNGDQMLVEPYGFWKWIGTVKRSPDGPQAMQNTLRPINLFGFRKALVALRDVYHLANERGECKEEFGGFVRHEDSGRDAIKLIRYLPPRNDYPAKKTVIYIDAEHLVPIGVDGWDWNDKLFCHYVYKDVRFNLGLKDEQFTPKANSMKDPK